ncbi:MAG: DNA translocase FtsK 4TM domain-containing protein [Rickettsiales bacterium]|nr:DNA translocase FtsK 4TM domain-containing protein [Rickettsiales bacterium]
MITDPNKFRSSIAGIAYIAWSTLCFTILLFYSAQDVSFNISTNAAPTHVLGTFGSYSADLLLQVFGFASYLLAIVPLLWGIKNLTSDSVTAIWVRIICLCVALPLLSWSFAHFHNIFSQNLPFTSPGGAVGNLINNMIGEIKYYVSYVILAIFLIIINFAIGTTLGEWLIILKYTIRTTKKILYILYQTTKILMQWIHSKISKTDDADNLIDIPLSEGISQKTEEDIAIIKKIHKPIEKIIEKPLKIFNTTNRYALPSSNLLNPYKKNKNTNDDKLTKDKALELAQVLKDFGVQGQVTNYFQGPVVTLYELEPAAGTKSSRIIGLSNDIARSMKVISTRIAVIPGKNSLGIELPNKIREVVYLKEILEDQEYNDNSHKLPIILGKDIGGRSVVVDLTKMPHLLIAGTTGSGKSVAINTMILSLLFKHTPETCRFIMIDPKMLELSIYEGIPHLLAPVVTNPSKAISSLKWVVKEMENRYSLMSNLSVRNIENYNIKIMNSKEKGEKLFKTIQTGFDPETGAPIYEKAEIPLKTLPFIVVIVDEMADLMIVAGKEIEASVQRLAQMARASGIHIIMATQRPSVDVITGVIKANFPTRVSFQVTSKIDSRTILGDSGAEQLLGRGDMLYMSGGEKIKRVHGPFVDDSEVEKVVSFWKTQGTPDYSVDITSGAEQQNNSYSQNEKDELFEQAVALVKKDKRVSTSYIQRYFKIGYNRAANIVEQMEAQGIVSSPGHSGKREVLE